MQSFKVTHFHRGVSPDRLRWTKRSPIPSAEDNTALTPDCSCLFHYDEHINGRRGLGI